MNVQATIVADSINKQGDRITTMLLTFPRFLLAELNTHRMFSKNSASSRAIPFNKMIESVENNPFIPSAWQKDHKGMQGTEYHLNPEIQIKTWLEARDYAIKIASNLNNKDCNVTKQLCNRLLEPFMWHTVLLTSMEFNNFFSLRCPQYEHTNWVTEDNNGVKQFSRSKKDYINVETGGHYHEHLKEQQFAEYDWLNLNKGQAEIHMMALAEAMWDAKNESTPKVLQPGEWHIPFEDKINLKELGVQAKGLTSFHDNLHQPLEAIKVSTAMCARTSYTIVGDEKEFTYQQQLSLYDKLSTLGHYSPFEHCAKAMSDKEYWLYNRSTPGKIIDDKVQEAAISPGWCKNYKGFIQYRELLENK